GLGVVVLLVHQPRRGESGTPGGIANDQRTGGVQFRLVGEHQSCFGPVHQLGFQGGSGGGFAAVQTIQTAGPTGQHQGDQPQRDHDDQAGVGRHQRCPRPRVNRLSHEVVAPDECAVTIAYTARICAATSCQSKRSTAVSAYRRRRWHSSVSVKVRTRVAANASLSPVLKRKPEPPSSNTRRKAGRSLATTLVPALIASTRTIPKLSPPVCGAT